MVPEKEMSPKRSLGSCEIQASPSGKLGELRAQLVECRLRVREAPEEQADGHSSK